MNKETISKYKAEFDWWLNNGKLLCKYTLDDETKWIDPKDNSSSFFNSPIKNILYIIDDEYVEFRKAQAEGKTIQLNDGSQYCPNWNKAYPELTPFESYPLELYRIEPEPEFKIGDWVIVNCQVTTQYITKFTKQLLNLFHNELYNIKLWKPTQGKLCIFYNDNTESYRISKFNIIAHGSGRTGQYKDAQGNYFTNARPLEFVQTLKDR